MFSFSNSYGSREMISSIKKTETFLLPKFFSCLRVRYKGTFIRPMALTISKFLTSYTILRIYMQKQPCIWKPLPSFTVLSIFNCLYCTCFTSPKFLIDYIKDFPQVPSLFNISSYYWFYFSREFF